MKMPIKRHYFKGNKEQASSCFSRTFALAGFTLVELICVLALMALLAAVATPAVKMIGRTKKLEFAAREVATEMRKAQQKAVSTGNAQRIDFRIYNNDYRVRDLGTNDVYTVRLPEGVTYRSVNFPAEGGFPRLTFYRTGAPSRGGTISLQGPGDNLTYIIITPATGRVRISDLPPDHW